jgi:error-prone DNA polymerase
MRAAARYAELHCHSAYSFLDGASLPAELAGRAAELGYRSVALTDHDSLCGAMEFSMAARECGLHAILGAELTVGASEADREASRKPKRGSSEGTKPLRHLTLLVRDGQGWRSLCRLLTLAHADTRRGDDRRVGQPTITLEALECHGEGLVCLSGCATEGIHDEPTLRRLLSVFGPDGLWVELQRPYLRHDRARNRALSLIAQRLGVKTLATGNVHAHSRGRAELQDALVAVRHGMSLDACETQRRGNHSHVMSSPEAMAARFTDHPEAVAETGRLAEMLRFDLCSDLGYRYPGSESRQAIQTLSEICQAAFAERYPADSRFREQAAGRLEGELRVIDGLGLAGFFVLHHEILQLAREVATEVRGSESARGLLPPGRGRGSSVSSIVCYLTGLSHIDPVEHELAIGRFLHEDIQSLPDIDLDFPRDIRERLIPRIHEHYGREHSALVAAFPTFKARGAIRELGKALGLPAGEIELVARAADAWGPPEDLSADIERALGKKRARSVRWEWLVRLAREAYGLPRHLSQHSGGMVISTRPLVDCCPVVPAAMEGRQIAQWDKDSCADAGFLKIDLLGLGMLSAVERCVELIARHTGARIDLSRIPFDDPETFRCIQNAETTGVFQIESRAQMGSLRRTRPETLQDLTIQVALVRPGPIVGGAVNPYIERRQRLRVDPTYEIPYAHPSLREPLENTLGTIIFQDQVIEVARAFAGFTAGEAESLRRAMSRKRSQEAMGSHRQQFLAGAMATHPDLEEACAQKVWEMVAGFAGFGFPKGHGAAFGLLAYQSTWLRVHHPAAFLCSLLNEQPMGFYPSDSLIHEAQRRRITTLMPDVNSSHAECTLTSEGQIHIGLSYIKGIHRHDIANLLHARQTDGAFRSLEDFASRAGLSRPVLERLAWAGACDNLAGESRHARRAALWQLGIASVALPVAEDAGTQLALEMPLQGAPDLPGLEDWDAMLADYATTGVSISRHPLKLRRAQLDGEGALSTAQLAATPHGSQVMVAGLVIARQRPGTANGITFLLLEDEQGTLNVIVPPPLYKSHRQIVRVEPLIIVTGRLERHANGGGAINLLAVDMRALKDTRQPPSEVKRIPGTETHEQGRADREQVAATGTEDFRAVAPAAMNFAQGRRR